MVISIATALVILGLSVLLLFTPVYMRAALDAAGAPQVLGVTSEQAQRLSDATVRELFLGPGTFAFAGPDGQPFYDADEASHLRDVRLVLLSFVALAGVSLVLLLAAFARGRHEPATWTALSRGGAGLALLLAGVGLAAVVAFDTVFELFHRVFFPGGNWAFDPSLQRLVQLYPLPFWQLTAGALGVLAIGAGALVWFLARRRSRELRRHAAPAEDGDR